MPSGGTGSFVHAGGGGLGVGRRVGSFVDAPRRLGARVYFTDYRLCCPGERGMTGSGDTDGKGGGGRR